MDTFGSRPEMDDRVGEQALKALARALAPYLVYELRSLVALEQEGLDGDYDDATCRRFIADLGTHVLGRARILFQALHADTVIDSVRLAELLGIAPRELSGNLTTPLKRRAKVLGLPLPFAGGRGEAPYGGIAGPSPDMDRERTHWQDRHNIAGRMVTALNAEIATRTQRTGVHTDEDSRL